MFLARPNKIQKIFLLLAISAARRMRDVKQNALGRKRTHIQGNVEIRSDEDLLALEVGIGQIGHGLLAGRHGLLVVLAKNESGGEGSG